MQLGLEPTLLFSKDTNHKCLYEGPHAKQLQLRICFKHNANVRRVPGNKAGTFHWCAVKGLRNYITGPGLKGSCGAALCLIFLAFGYTTIA